MAHAYTPGLKVTEKQKVTKQRILPLKGEVLVKKGDCVSANDVVARTFLPGHVEPINLVHMLSINPEDVPECMLKQIGDTVEKGEALAETKGIFGFFKSKALARVHGKIESVSNITGQVILRGDPIPVEVKAYINGLVTEVIPENGVVIETDAMFVQGIFGIGGETNGEVVFATTTANEKLDEDKIKPEFKDKIVIGGGIVTAGALRKAVSLGIRGIITGGIDDQDLRDFMKCDIGVAITGSEDLGVTLIITEGFSDISMSGHTYELLKKNEGKFSCINGTTQIRAGVMRPEVIVPSDPDACALTTKAVEAKMGIADGSPVRIIRQPYFGKLGVVTDLPAELHRLESWSMARVCKVKLDGNSEVLIPRANIEIIEG